MNKRTLLSFIALMTLGSTGLAQNASQGPNTEQTTRERGKVIIAEAFSVLSTNLQRALMAGGISNALPYCSVQASALTSAVSSRHPVVVRRISHKPRNPTNEANAMELQLIKDFQAQVTPGQMPQPVLVTNDAGYLTLYAPIAIANPLCLQCHGRVGKELNQDTVQLIRKLYPQDQATGFQFGELRGLWRVEFRPLTGLAR